MDVRDGLKGFGSRVGTSARAVVFQRGLLYYYRRQHRKRWCFAFGCSMYIFQRIQPY